MKLFFSCCVVFLLTLSACGSSQLMTESLKISQGQTKDEVLSLLGPPGNRQFQGKDEAWQWCSTGMSTDDFLVVWFYDGYVTGITTYKNSIGFGSCDQFYRTVRWEDAPDRTIEIRKR
jgi:hypothetical protein